MHERLTAVVFAVGAAAAHLNVPKGHLTTEEARMKLPEGTPVFTYSSRG
jgi:hypothetical protein